MPWISSQGAGQDVLGDPHSKGGSSLDRNFRFSRHLQNIFMEDRHQTQGIGQGQEHLGKPKVAEVHLDVAVVDGLDGDVCPFHFQLGLGGDAFQQVSQRSLGHHRADQGLSRSGTRLMDHHIIAEPGLLGGFFVSLGGNLGFLGQGVCLAFCRLQSR